MTDRDPRVDPDAAPRSTSEARATAARAVAENARRGVRIGGPGTWWRLGVAALVVIAAILLLGRFLSGNSAGPNTEPQSTSVQPTAPTSP